MARPAGLEPATSWFVGHCRCLASLVFRVCSSDPMPLVHRVRELIVHRLFIVTRPIGRRLLTPSDLTRRSID